MILQTEVRRQHKCSPMYSEYYNLLVIAYVVGCIQSLQAESLGYDHHSSSKEETADTVWLLIVLLDNFTNNCILAKYLCYLCQTLSKYTTNFSRSVHCNTEVTPICSYTSSRTDAAHKHNSQFAQSKFAPKFVEGFSVKTKRMLTNLDFVNH